MTEQNYIERYWRDATPEDAIKEPPMLARFRDYSEVKWTEVPLQLMGLCRASCAWLDTDGDTFDFCQVYDAPDPGEGWRLVDVDTEAPIIGDEIHDKRQNRWIIRSHDKPYNKELTYRRRIEQPKPKPKYEPFKWEDREQLRGRLIYYVDRNRKVEFRCESFAVDDNGLMVNDAYADWLCKHAVFVDTKEPVGRRVE